MQREYAGNVDIVGVASRDEVDAMTEFISNTGVTDFLHLADLNAEVWAEFGVQSQPSFAFVNDDGTFTVHIGALGVEGLTEQIEALIAA